MSDRRKTAARLALLLTPIAIWMWLAMMLVHELGHVTAAWLTGGKIVHVDVFPGRLSSTLVRPNPRPGVVLWSGMVAGWIVPLLAAMTARKLTPRLRRLLDCWAAFCLLAGGVYLAVGGADRLTDTGQLVAAGWPLSVVVAIGTAVAIAGYAWSRRTWPMFIAAVQQPTPRSIVIAWFVLLIWVAGQWVLATALSSLTNVR